MNRLTVADRRFRTTLPPVRNRLSSSVAAFLSQACSTSPSVVVSGSPWPLSSSLSSLGVQRLSKYRASRGVSLEDPIGAVHQRTTAVAGATLHMPTCPTCDVRCRILSSVLGQTGEDHTLGTISPCTSQFGLTRRGNPSRVNAVNREERPRSQIVPDPRAMSRRTRARPPHESGHAARSCILLAARRPLPSGMGSNGCRSIAVVSA